MKIPYTEKQKARIAKMAQQFVGNLNKSVKKEMGRPEYGKQYALTGEVSIMSGNTWKESEIKS